MIAQLLSGDLESWHSLLQAAWQRLYSTDGAALLLLWFTIALAAIVTFFRSPDAVRSVRGFLRHLVPWSTVIHPSARADFLFWLSRRLFIPFLVIPLAISTVAAGHVSYKLLTLIFGQPSHSPGQAGPLTLGLFTVTMLIAYDLSYWCYHYLQHKVPLLWELHKVHHSAEVMIGVTKDRVHPIDEIMNRWWDGLIPGFVYGVWLFFVLDPVELTVFGLNVYMLRNVLVMMDFVRHTHMKFSYGRYLNAVFLCPHWHQLHHSVAREHWDKNFGLALSVWDRLFGTLYVPKPGEDFKFGLPDKEADEYQSLLRLHLLPLKKMAALIHATYVRRRRGSVAQKPADLVRQSEI